MVYDYRGWLTVDGPRFMAFFPLGSRAHLERDTIYLAQAFQWDPIAVKQLSCSERHRYVKMKEAITAEERARMNNQTTMPQPSTPTGIDSRAKMQDVGLRYTGF